MAIETEDAPRASKDHKKGEKAASGEVDDPRSSCEAPFKSRARLSRRQRPGSAIGGSTYTESDAQCSGRLLAIHEGGCSSAYAPFCTLAVMRSRVKAG